MKLRAKIVAAILALVTFAANAQQTELNLIPLPLKVQKTQGSFKIDNTVSITGNATFEVGYLKEKIEKSSGITLGNQTQKRIEINIVPDNNLKEEGYKLNVTPDKISIAASDKAGAFYGVQTLMQLMPPAIYGKGEGWEKWEVPCVEIEDYPRFSYRGTHLDVSPQT